MSDHLDLVLIHPPVALPSEPPLGQAVVARTLRSAGAALEVVDANIEALDWLIERPSEEEATGAAERRSLLHRERALRHLRSPRGFENQDRHRAAVEDLRQVLALASAPHRVDLAAYHHAGLAPQRSADLLTAARDHGQSPFADYFEALARRVEARSPRVVGISVNYLHQALPAMALAGALRRRLGDGARILAGGALFGCWRGRLAPDALAPCIDRVVHGDGAPTLLEALGLDPPPDPGALLPDYSDAPWERYLAPVPIVAATTSVGCHWARCRYCPEAATQTHYSGEVLGPSIHGRLEALCHDTRAGLLHLTDSAIPPANLRQLASAPLPAPWYGFVRFSSELASADHCRRLRAAGCDMLQLGLESGSPQVLKRLRKGIDLSRASAALGALSAAGIRTYLYVMFGTPGESMDDARQTLTFLVDHAHQITYLNVSLLNLPLVSPDEPGLRRRPFPREGDLSLYSDFSVEHDGESWDRRAARRFMEREVSRHPRVAPLLRRTPTVFGANHALLCAL